MNYVADLDGILYKTVRIGSQVWMAENLNTGVMVQAPGNEFPTRENGIVEKLCYENEESNCDLYGGLYMWEEMMDYAPADTGEIGITQGICPAGWHLPTKMEWEVLKEFLGEDNPGGKLKDTSQLWFQPNVGANNETGFSGLPAGFFAAYINPGTGVFNRVGDRTLFWTTYRNSEYWNAYRLMYDNPHFGLAWVNRRTYYPNALSVRCIKDP